MTRLTNGNAVKVVVRSIGGMHVLSCCDDDIANAHTCAYLREPASTAVVRNAIHPLRSRSMYLKIYAQRPAAACTGTWLVRLETGLRDVDLVEVPRSGWQSVIPFGIMKEEMCT